MASVCISQNLTLNIGEMNTFDDKKSTATGILSSSESPKEMQLDPARERGAYSHIRPMNHFRFNLRNYHPLY